MPLYTEEQQVAIGMALRRETMKVSALAGTGKTTTLVGIAKGLAPRKGTGSQSRGLYLAFNKAIATEAQEKFHGTGCDARTFHSLAYASHGRVYGSRLGARLNGSVIAKEFNVPGSDGILVSRAALDTAGRFLRTLDDRIGQKHFCWGDITDYQAKNLPPDARDRYFDLRERALPIAREIYASMADKKGSFPVTHDFYLREFVKSMPDLSRNCDYLLFDEAQDADPLMLALTKSQKIPVIYVGDRFQQIYGWRGAENAMAGIDVPEAFLSMSFRFGDGVAEMANRALGALGSELALRGHPDKESTCHFGQRDARAFVARTNASVISATLIALGEGKRVGVSGKAQLLQTIGDFTALRSGSPKGQFALFSDERELREYADQESDGKDVKAFLKIVDQYGSDRLESAIQSARDLDQEKGAWSSCDFVAVTGHKSKGLEFDSVRLSDDFFQEGRLFSKNRETGEKRLREEEMRLLYVAMTRAKNTLVFPCLKEDAEDLQWLSHPEDRLAKISPMDAERLDFDLVDTRKSGKTSAIMEAV